VISTEVIGIVVLILIFVVGTLTTVNIGALALAASFALGMGLAGEDLDTVLSGFPVDMFLILFGVTYLFAVAANNGTVSWLVQICSSAVRGKKVILPLVIFLVSVVPTAFGAVGPAVVALLAPVAMRVARRHNLSPQLAGLLVVHGTTAGGFSPLNLGGVIVNGTLERNGIPSNPVELFFFSFAYNLVLGLVLWQTLEGIRRRSVKAEIFAEARAGASSNGQTDLDAHVAADVADEDTVGFSWRNVVTIAAFLGVAAGAVVLGIDIGLLALAAAVILNVVASGPEQSVTSKVAWDAIVLICGLLTFVAVLERIGTVEMVGHSVARLDSPLLGALFILLAAGAVSAFASTFGTVGALVPLSLPLLATGDITVSGFAVALAISASVVDASPFSTNGALLIAGSPETERRRTYRILLRWGVAMVVTAPVVTWLVFVVAM
jgi:di/tricarboxylate transporter